MLFINFPEFLLNGEIALSNFSVASGNKNSLNQSLDGKLWIKQGDIKWSQIIDSEQNYTVPYQNQGDDDLNIKFCLIPVVYSHDGVNNKFSSTRGEAGFYNLEANI